MKNRVSSPHPTAKEIRKVSSTAGIVFASLICSSLHTKSVRGTQAGPHVGEAIGGTRWRLYGSAYARIRGVILLTAARDLSAPTPIPPIAPPPAASIAPQPSAVLELERPLP